MALTRERRKELEHRSGLDVLRSYIPEKDYNDSLIEHAAKGTPEIDDDNSRGPVRQDMIEKSVAILSYLRDNGYDFSVQADRNDGQLSAKLANNNISVRILDTDKDAQYIGRVHNDGITYYYSTKSYNNKDVNVTPEMAVDMVKYALGESVNRVDDRGATSFRTEEHVGEVDKNGAYSPHTYAVEKNGAIGSFTTLYSSGKLRQVLDTTAKGRGGVNPVSDNVYIYAAVDMNQNSSIKFRGDTALTDAENFIEDSRTNAINNFTKELKLEAVDVLAQSKAKGEFDGLPEFSANTSDVVDMQTDYYDSRLAIYSNSELDDNARADALYEHDEAFKKTISERFGSVQGHSINPVAISAYMDKSKGTIINEGNLLSACKTVQRNGEPYELIGDDFANNGFKDKMVTFNSNPVYDNDGKQIYPKNINPDSPDYEQLSDFWKNIGSAVKSGLNETGVNVGSIAVDENGVIHYEGDRHIGTAAKSKPENKVIGNIGQVFEPIAGTEKADGSLSHKAGLIETKFNSGNNYYIAPGYTAYVVPPTAETADKSYEERTRLRGYEQEMVHEIKSTLRHDVASSNSQENTAGLNGVYHHIYGDKLPLDFEEQMIQEGKDSEMIQAIVDSSLRRVRYDNCYKENTDMLSEINSKQLEYKADRGYDIYLDNVKANMAIMNPDTSKGIFDPYATGTGTNQGAVRYLTKDAVVNPDGSITKGESTQSPLLAHSDFKYAEYNPPDRLIMSYMNSVNQSSTARGRTETPDGKKIEPIGVGTAHMSLGGFTQDDAFVISKEFAEANMIRGKDGKMRPLQMGDKICDHSGNKGVISFIADRNADMSYFEPTPVTDDMSPAERRRIMQSNESKADQKRIVELFKDNPTLDVVGAPYTAPSRFNGGTAREMIESQEKAHAVGMGTTLNVEGKEYPGSIGYVNWLVTDMPVDEKTHIYDEEGGRKSSGQLICCLAASGAKDVISEFYEYNTEPTIKLRELSLAMGVDVSQTGELRMGYEPHIVGNDENGKPVYEQRNEFSVTDAFMENRDAKGALHRKNYSEAFAKAMNDDGGFMKLPFPIKMASGEMTPEKLDENGKGTGEYMFPVLAAKYRSGRETVDNKLLIHEYTSDYKNIYTEAGNYLSAKEKLADARASGDAESIDKQTKAVSDAMEKAQSSYDKMAEKIEDRFFTGKHNVFKDDVMRRQLPNTATAVISPDPTLNLNQCRMSAKMAERLTLIPKDADLPDWSSKVCIGRDPYLSNGGYREMEVVVVEDREGRKGYDSRNPFNDMVGIAINPSAATSFEGDFDGDSVSVTVLNSKKARENSHQTLSYEAQLLNREAGNKGEHSLYFQDGLDVAAGIYADKQRGGNIAERFEEAKRIANEADLKDDKDVSKGSANRKALNMLNSAMHDAHRAAFGCDVISYASPEEHFKSLIPMTQSGAKGSPSKLINGYGPYFGCKAEIDENFNLTKFEDTGVPYASDEARKASLAATHAKAVLTGVAGKFFQHGMMMAKNSDDMEKGCMAVVSLTHPATQSVMQLKHDGADEILQKIDMITNVAPALWAGEKIQRVDGDKPTWEIVQNKNLETGKLEPMAVSPEEWKKTFMEFYTDKHGLNVAPPNPEHIETMAKIMTVTENGKEIIKGFDSKSKTIMPMEKPLDRQAYEGSFETYLEFAKKNANLFEGSVNELVAPKAVRNNIEESRKSIEDPDYVPKYKALSAKDTQANASLDTPSVDAVDKALKSMSSEDIHIVQEQNDKLAETESYDDDKSEDMSKPVSEKASSADVSETKKTASVAFTPVYAQPVAAPTEPKSTENKAERSFRDLSESEKRAVSYSVAKKVIDEPDKSKREYTSVEREFMDMCTAQNKIQQSMVERIENTSQWTVDSRKRVQAYVAEHPGAFNELNMYCKGIKAYRDELVSSKPSIERFESAVNGTGISVPVQKTTDPNRNNDFGDN